MYPELLLPGKACPCQLDGVSRRMLTCLLLSFHSAGWLGELKCARSQRKAVGCLGHGFDDIVHGKLK